MTDIVSVINLTGHPVDKTHEPCDAIGMKLLAVNQHIVILVSDETPFGRIVKAHNFFKDIAISTKVVDEKFENQYMLAVKDFTSQWATS